MDINKLKGRLNLKFEPIQSQRKSLKKIQALQAKQKLKQQQPIPPKLRSNSQIKLPSLHAQNRSKIRLETLQDSKSYINTSQFRQRAKSFKQIPKVKIEGKEAINSTITFLMKNQILTVPRMVALLQKNQSDQFIYLRMTGIYQYQACDEKDKGAAYVTVSKNGMVQNGQLITLQTLVRQFQVWKKLKKIEYFKTYHSQKYLQKWKQATLRTRYQKTRQNLTRQLNLKDRNYLQWKIQIINFFNIQSEGGWIQDSWIYKLADNVRYVKDQARKKLVGICYKMLEGFDLPISESTDLLNRVLGNLAALNITFEKKIRIQKECQRFYKLGRQLELSAMEKTASFILTHLKTLITKVSSANSTYKSSILQKLQQLDLSKQSFTQQRQKILSDSAVSFDMDYTLYFNTLTRSLSIRPSPADIYSNCMGQIKIFIKEMDKMGFKIIRTDDFRFVSRIVFKSGEEEEDYEEMRFVFRNFVMSVPRYEELSRDLQAELMMCQDTFNKRVELYGPFLSLYLEYLEDTGEMTQFNFEQVYSLYQKIQADYQFTQKLDEGEYFILGFLKTNEFRRQLLDQIKKKQSKLYKTIPLQLNLKRQKLQSTLSKHLQILNNEVSSAATFIQISEEVQVIQDHVLEYVSVIQEIQKIGDFYEKCTKNRLVVLKDQKKYLQELKAKMKSFLQTRQANFMKYRKSLQSQKTALTKKTHSLTLTLKSPQFYTPIPDPTHPNHLNTSNNPNNPNPNTSNQSHQIHKNLQQITKNLKQMQSELIELNKLQFYFNLKPTSFTGLDLLIREYQNLEEIWKYTTEVEADQGKLERKVVREIEEERYIRYYDVFRRKADKYAKDPDLAAITQNCLQKIQTLIQTMQTIQLLNSPHLRQSDLDQLTYQIQRKLSVHELGTIKPRQLTYQKLTEQKISELKPTIAEIVFKAKKQIQITQNLNQFNQWWKGIKLDYETMELFPWVVVFGENLKLRDQIDQYMTMLINVLNNKYGNFVRNQCNKLLKKLNNLAQLLQLAQIHQQKFLNLFPILTSKYAQTQLSAQCKKFDTILHKTMKNLKLLIKPTQNLNQSTKNILNTHIKHFDAISSVLSKFLESKRLKFQRFYFLQDYEMMEVLVGIADQRNVFRMFQGIKGWLVQDGIKVGVVGIGDEKLVLKGWNYKNVQPQLIFKSLQQSIKSNLNSIVRTVLYQYEIQLKQLKDLYQGIPWMCLYAVQMILFTKQVQLNCFHENIPLQAQQSLLRQAVNHAIVKPSQYSNYITLLLHLLHFTQQMRKENVNSIFNFQWHSFLRFYYQKDNVVMRAMSNQIRWGGEYQGMWSLMVNTSDIKRAHVCVLNNIQYANGVLLQGPSGTGKTQSLKQLARCTAKYCVIFNCSQNVNLKTVSKLLSGLCYTASWLCLDQINRLTLQAMSTIAKQIQSIRTAILSKKEVFNFLGKDIKLRQGVAIFATMNPIYLKRAKLTENIKSYFRTITVSMPEHQAILEVLLYGLKFYKPRELAKKIGSSFSNLSIQLSKNLQYDFGLRAMKFLISSISKRRTESKNQNEIVAKAFYDIFLFKLSPSDRSIFQKVISDIFMYTLPDNDATMKRVFRMRDSPQTGTIVFGPVSIKSTLIKEYCRTYQGCDIELYNPNSAEMRYFLGGSIHGRWEEGVVQKIARQSLSFPQKMHLLVLDSTLKSQIIQNFNTLLDQSKLLTLSNGTRLKIQDNLKIIMQTQHLNLTSPSTITRCNIIYVCDKDVQTQSLIEAQLPQGLRKSDQANKIRKIYEKLLNSQIREVGKLSKIIISERYEANKVQWKENQVLGLEKAVIFAARILGLEAKIKDCIQKDNSFHAKKSPFHHILAYERYAEGQFIEISRTYSPIIEYQSFTLKTSMEIFMKWLTKKATSRQVQPILWKGNPFDGKSKGTAFSLKGLKHIKISLNSSMSSSTMAQLLLPQILDKKNDQLKQSKPQLIIYIENLHMSNEQLSQQIRFMMQNNKIFSMQAKQFVSIQALAFVAQSRHFQTKQFDRVRRHFSQVPLPKSDQLQLKNIYYQILKHNIESTNLDQTLKNLINIESQRFCTFLANIFEIKCQKKLEKNGRLGLHCMGKVLDRARCLNLDNCRNVGDFVGVMFQAVRVDDQFGVQDAVIQKILQLYHTQYNSKFFSQYELYLKNSNIILKQTSSLGESSPKKSKKPKQSIFDKLESMDKNLYVSSYFKAQVEIALRILENDASHYCLISTQGSGRKTILKTACKLSGLTLHEPQQQLPQKQIKKIYFERMTKSIQNSRKEIILLDLQNPSHVSFLQFAEAVAIGSPVTQLFQSEESDYMFASITDYVDDYDKSSKSYEDICQDYMMLAQSRIQFLIVSTPSAQIPAKKLLQNYPTIHKKLYLRTLPQFPTQSLLQCLQKILQTSTKQSQALKQSLPIDRLPKLFIKIYKIFNGLALKNKENQLHHFNFNQFHLFQLVKEVMRFCQKNLGYLRENQEIMNRSIGRIGDIGRVLGKLKEEIMKTQPEVVIKRNRILQVVPVLQQKKKKTESIKYAVETERKQIQIKKDEISILMKQVQQQIAQSTPLLSQAIQSIQTIKRNQLSEIKNNMNPHSLVKFTMENMVILLGESENWDNVRRILSDANLLVRIKNCQPTHQAYLRVKKRVNQNPEWTFDAISKISFGARYLFKWIKSIIKYKDIESSITKKKQYVQKLSQSLKQSQLEATKKQSQLTSKEQDSHQIELEYSKITKELNDLQQLMENNKRKLVNAEKIKGSLEENFVKWEEKIRYYKEFRGCLAEYNVGLGLEVMVYPGLAAEEIEECRKQVIRVLTQQSLNIPKNPTTLLTQTILSQKTPLTQSLTHLDHLDPKKQILSYYFNKKPLLIDPDNQASNWLAKLSLNQRIIYTRRTFNGAMKTVEDAMKYGDVLVVLVDGEIDGFGREVLRCLAVGGNQVEYNKSVFVLHQDFRLLFCCKSKNPVINPTTSLNHQLINFQITKLSLQSHLLHLFLQSQKPALFQLKSTIDQNMQTTQTKIQEMQLKIIQILMNNKKNLIQDESFIQLLEENKGKRAMLDRDRGMKEEHVGEIAQFLGVFGRICEEVAELFVVLKMMGRVNANLIWDVQIFVNYFLEACNYSISEVTENQDQEEEELMEVFGAYEFEEVNHGLSRPGTAFSSMSLSLSRLTSQMQQPQQLQIPTQRTIPQNPSTQPQPLPTLTLPHQPQQLRTSTNPSKPIFNLKTITITESLKGTITKQRYNKIINYLLNYLKKGLTQKERYTLGLLFLLRKEKKEDLRNLFGVVGGKRKGLQGGIEMNLFTENLKAYLSKFNAEQMEAQAHRIISQPDHLLTSPKSQLSILQTLMLCQTISPQSFLPLTQKILQKSQISTLLDYEQLKVSDWLQQSDNIHPILLLMGEDPIQLIRQYLERKKYKHATLIAMGQDQGKGLDVHIEKECRKEGLFIIHNFHIGAAFMGSLVRLIQQFGYRPPHRNFRLVLIGSLDSQIPQEITSVCHKFIVQQPSGIKNKMRDLYKKSQSYIDHSNPTQHKLSYSLCLMHSIINQMQKYGSLCWNFPPSYTTSDFIGCIFAVKAICQKKLQIEDFQCNIEREHVQKEINQERIDFGGLRYLIGETCYVGKLSDNIDRRKMRVIVGNHFGEDIMRKNYVFWQGSKLSDHPLEVDQCIQAIEQENPRTCGLHQNATPSRQLPTKIFSNISSIHFSSTILSQILQMSHQPSFSPLQPITHRLPFITQQIASYNANGIFEPRSYLLKEIKPETRVFNLKAFSNPRQLFVSVKLEVAVRSNVPYDGVGLIWGFGQKDGWYGVEKLGLEGGCIKNGVLVPGFEQRDLVLYFSAVLKKKDKDPNKGKTPIPLYLSQQRGQLIDNYGQNTNLLTQVYLDSKQPPQSWVLKGTAFVAS